MQGLLAILFESYRLFYAVFSCNHANAPFTEGKSICPDCGRTVILQWAVLRCEFCQTKRASRFIFRTVFPLENYCTACGQNETRLDYLENPAYYHLHKAILVVQDEHAYLNRHQAFTGKPKVWFDSAGSQTPESKHANNICRGLLAPAI